MNQTTSQCKIHSLPFPYPPSYSPPFPPELTHHKLIKQSLNADQFLLQCFYQIRVRLARFSSLHHLLGHEEQQEYRVAVWGEKGRGQTPWGGGEGTNPWGGGVRTEDDVVPMAQANCTHYPSSLSPRLTKLSISPNSIAKSCSNVLGKRDSFTTSTTGFFTTLSLSSSSIPSPYGCGEGREEGEGGRRGRERRGGREKGRGGGEGKRTHS